MYLYTLRQVMFIPITIIEIYDHEFLLVGIFHPKLFFFWVRFWSVQSEKTFLTRLCEARANTQFLGVLLVITLKFVRETIVSKTSESYLGSCSSTISCQGHLTEHQGDIRQRNCLKKSIVYLCSSGSKLPTTCLILTHVLKQRMHIGHNKLLISSSAS